MMDLVDLLHPFILHGSCPLSLSHTHAHVHKNFESTFTFMQPLKCYGLMVHHLTVMLKAQKP